MLARDLGPEAPSVLLRIRSRGLWRLSGVEGFIGLGLIAHIVFWMALLAGAFDIGVRRTAVFAALWAAGYVAARWLPGGDFLFASWVAVLAIVLILLVHKGDVRLT
jgi:hypothetical protein